MTAYAAAVLVEHKRELLDRAKSPNMREDVKAALFRRINQIDVALDVLLAPAEKPDV